MNNIHIEYRKAATMLKTLNLSLTEDGEFCDSRGRLHRNAVKLKLLNLYRNVPGCLQGKAAATLVDSVLDRFLAAAKGAMDYAKNRQIPQESEQHPE